MKFFFSSTGARRFASRLLFCFLLCTNAANAVASPPGETPHALEAPTFPSPVLQLPEAPSQDAPPQKATSRESEEWKETPPVLATPIPQTTTKPSTATRKVGKVAAPIASTRDYSVELARRGETLPQAAKRLGLKLPLANGEVRVWKARRRLEIWTGNKLLKSYAVSLGAQPLGHKQRQGDGRTPEGRYYICTRNAKTSAFHIFLGLSYPALPDAARAANSRQISPREYALIRSRLASRSAPLWRTRLGGWVGIHGGSDAAFARKQRSKRGNSDWTAGCIALTNREIEEIYAATRIGTPVLVRP